ncbi:unnamed protein product [Caenorhabditis auriculariae]|uniref:C-type lectin domain-containing protein n=1 Tax=Caenorhabditis auriculariae TaxID=2777116 RepID=A0A8S1HSP6_9PELO|nr:unnamed protein product [Caenorhabditis auriculariae]
MARLTALFASALLLFTVEAAPCPTGWSYFNTTASCYLLSPKLVTFDEASQMCISNGGSLLSVKSWAEMTFLTTLSSSNLAQPWIGTRRNLTTGKFYNLDGSYLSTIYWGTNEPSTNGDCVSLKATDPNGLHANPCYDVQPALCRQPAAVCNTLSQGGLYTRSGTFTSPGYPTQYFNNLRCQYLISSPNNTYITISFYPYFVENYRDFIAIFDGNTTSYAYNIGQIQSSSDRMSFEGTKNQMTVLFNTNSAVTDKGWQAKWQAKILTTPITQEGLNGSLTSPNYPNNYDPYTEQLYYITGLPGFKINITIDVFNTETKFDYLEIYNTANVSSTSLIANFSGPSVAPWTTVLPANVATLRFMSDGIVQKTGTSRTPNHRGFRGRCLRRRCSCCLSLKPGEEIETSIKRGFSTMIPRDRPFILTNPEDGKGCGNGRRCTCRRPRAATVQRRRRRRGLRREMFLVAFFFVAVVAAEFDDYTAETFPDSITQPQLCAVSRPGFACDPNSILGTQNSTQTHFELDTELLRIRGLTNCSCNDQTECDPSTFGYTVSVAAVRKMRLATNETSRATVLAAAEIFADRVRWRQNRGQCDDDMLIFISEEDQVVWTSVGTGAARLINRDVVKRVSEEAETYFEKKSYMQGIEWMTKQYSKAFQQQKLDTLRRFGFWELLVIGSVVGFVLVALITLVVLCICKCARKNHQNEYEMGTRM